MSDLWRFVPFFVRNDFFSTILLKKTLFPTTFRFFLFFIKCEIVGIGRGVGALQRNSFCPSVGREYRPNVLH